MNTERFGESERFRKLNLSLRTPKVSNVYDFSVNHGPAWRSSPDERSGQIAFSDWQGSVRGHTPIASAVDTVNDGIGCFTQPGGILCDHIQDRLNIRRRAGDHTQDFARRGLLLQRFLELVEQSDVLNGDDSLIGKRFEQLDLCRSKRTNLHATRGQYSNELFLLTKRNGQVSMISDAGTHGWEIVLLLGVANVKRAMLAYPVNVWLINTDFDAANWYGTKMSPWNHRVTMFEPKHHVIDPANSRRAFDDGVEDRLHVRRRPA